MLASKWASIIFSRTYEVDYRLITLPEGFSKQDEDWANEYIYSTTKSPQNLPNNPIWSIFKNDRYCVVGVTCMLKELASNFSDELLVEVEQNIDNDSRVSLLAEDDNNLSSTSKDLIECCNSVTTHDNLQIDSEESSIENESLISQSQEISITETKDLGNREVYGFYGYVAKLKTDSAIQVPLMEIDIFQELYQEVVKVWNIKSYEQTVNPEKYQSRSKYEKEFNELQLISKDFSDNLKEKLNFTKNRFKIWSIRNNKKLWVKVAQSLKPVSLCLGLFREKDAVEGSFLNVTILGVDKFSIRQKLVEQSTYTEENYRITKNKDRPHQYSSEYNSSIRRPKKDNSGTYSKYQIEELTNDLQVQNELNEAEETLRSTNTANKINNFFENPINFVKEEISSALKYSPIDTRSKQRNSSIRKDPEKEPEPLSPRNSFPSKSNSSIKNQDSPTQEKEDENTANDPFDLFD